MALHTATEELLESVEGSDILFELSSCDPFLDVSEQNVETDYGPVRVAVQGNRKRRALFTYHDLGTNYRTCFRSLFAHPEMQHVLEYFCIYHINAPGHANDSEANCNSVSSSDSGKPYPTLEQLTTTIEAVARHFDVSHFIGLGVGVGANLFCRFHMAHPKMVDALVLLNADVTQAGWIERGWFKMYNWAINRSDQYQTVVEYLGWHWFGEPADRPHYLVMQYMTALKEMKRCSVSGLVTSFVNRSDLRLSREQNGSTLKCPTLLITGDTSPHVDSAVEANSRLNPTLNNFLKLADCGGMILDEAPGKVSESLRLFLQGLGYFPALRRVIPKSDFMLKPNHSSDGWPLASFTLTADDCINYLQVQSH